jgi:predicted nucleotidyltransferase
MPSVLVKLAKKELIKPPKWMPPNMAYEVQMGSVAYGVSDDTSDIDIYGFCIPMKEDIFPHLRGEIMGFGRQQQRFNQYDPHHIKDPDSGKEYDFAIYSIVKYFALVMENNPNMIDSLFVPRRCVLFSNEIGEMVRDRRKMFLHKGAFHKYKGYSYSQLHKIGKVNRSNPKRAADIDRIGYDSKMAYHVVRLILECEQIMIEHDLDITRNREQLKAIRRGEWSLEYLHEWFEAKEKALEGVYAESTLRHGPDEDAIRTLLMDCLEHHFGSLDKVVKRDVKIDGLIAELQKAINRYS